MPRRKGSGLGTARVQLRVGRTKARSDLEALRADLEAVAVAAQKVVDIEDWVSASDRHELRKALTRPGVVAVLEKHGRRGNVNSNDERSVAQSGSAPALGAGGRRFESGHSDQAMKTANDHRGGR